MKGFTYILRCADDTLYAGSTTDVEVRLQKHQDGSGAKYTRGRRPVQLVYVETFDCFNEALRREKQIQRLSRKKKMELISAGADGLRRVKITKIP